MPKSTQCMFSEVFLDGLSKMDGLALLIPSQVAMILGVSASTLEKYRDSGAHPLPFVSEGESVAYRVDDVRNYIKFQSDIRKAKEAKNAHELKAVSEQQKISRELEKVMAMAEVLKSLEGLPSDTVIPAKLAAVYLGLGEKTLSRMRQEGDGPRYIQHRANKKTRARNQRISYQLSDLQEYLSSRKVQSPLQAAKLLGKG